MEASFLATVCADARPRSARGTLRRVLGTDMSSSAFPSAPRSPKGAARGAVRDRRGTDGARPVTPLEP